MLKGRYPVTRTVNFVTRADVDANTMAFVDFVRSNEGQDILHSKAVVRL